MGVLVSLNLLTTVLKGMAPEWANHCFWDSDSTCLSLFPFKTWHRIEAKNSSATKLLRNPTARAEWKFPGGFEPWLLQYAKEKNASVLWYLRAPRSWAEISLYESSAKFGSARAPPLLKSSPPLF